MIFDYIARKYKKKKEKYSTKTCLNYAQVGMYKTQIAY